MSQLSHFSSGNIKSTASLSAGEGCVNTDTEACCDLRPAAVHPFMAPFSLPSQLLWLPLKVQPLLPPRIRLFIWRAHFLKLKHFPDWVQKSGKAELSVCVRTWVQSGPGSLRMMRRERGISPSMVLRETECAAVVCRLYTDMLDGKRTGRMSSDRSDSDILMWRRSAVVWCPRKGLHWHFLNSN